jgi:hypothetical protein
MKPGQRLVLLFTFPSGSVYAAGQLKGELSFVPVGDGGVLREVLAWESKEALVEWLKQFKIKNGEEKFKALCALKMRISTIQLPH